MKKILIAPNNFKESITAVEAARAIQKGLLVNNGETEIVCLPLSDGGEGFVDALISATGRDKINCPVLDPLGRKINSYYGSIDNETAIIEMALASGLELIAEHEKNPWLTTSYGTGELIKDAIRRGFKHIILGIGGSATNDVGMGLLEALGVQFYDDRDELLTERGAKMLSKVKSIDLNSFYEYIGDTHFTVACDVTNPLLGEHGATYVYGSQKGAGTAMLADLEAGVGHFSKVSNEVTGENKVRCEGAGAAGGIGYALMTYMKAAMKPGFDIVAEYTDLEAKVKQADLIITGEGKIDCQTAQGKVIARLAWMAQMYNKPLVAIGGMVDLNRPIPGIKSYYSIVADASDKEDAMKNASRYLNLIGQKIHSHF